MSILNMLCAGRYFMIPNGTDRSVAYCRRVDTRPSIYLATGVSWFLLGATTYSLPSVTCSDSEDAGNMKAPTDNIDSVVKKDIAGTYIATCLDRFHQCSPVVVVAVGWLLAPGCCAGDLYLHRQRGTGDVGNADCYG